MPLSVEAWELSRSLAAELGLPDPWDSYDFQVPSARSRPGHEYRMAWLPEGYAVHQGEGCIGESYAGVLGCWHSKQFMRRTCDMTALVPYDSRPLQTLEFTEEHIKTLKNTICRGASDAELQLFVYACQDTGLNPFLHQIWAISRNVKVGDKYEKQMTIAVGIDGYRVIRDRIRDKAGVPLFEGMDGPQWSEDGAAWTDVPLTAAPKFARVGIWRRGIPRPFIATARWDAYNQGNAMWAKMGPEQLAKCAEALALRRAFPAEMGKLPSGAVMDYDGPELAEPDAVDGEYQALDAPVEHGEAQASQSAPPAASPDASPPAEETPQPPAAWREMCAHYGLTWPELVTFSNERFNADPAGRFAKELAKALEERGG